ncbi:MAG: hypothetical protein HOV80_09375 [Polyangiaceae bacterium]|nr:hypothetical protein [Polyangiaceae bacterium]
MIRPCRIVHQGTVECSAFLVATTFGDAAARERVLEIWTRGTTVHKTARGYLVRTPARTRRSIDAMPGMPLVEVAFRGTTVLASAPLEERELEALAPHTGAVLIVRSGELERLEVSTPPEDPSAWIDLTEWTCSPVEPLGEPPPPPAMPAPNESIRDILGGALPPALPEAARIAEAIRSAGSDRLVAPGRTGSLASLLGALGALMSRWRGSRHGSGGASTRSTWVDRLAGWLTRQLYRVRLGEWLAQKHAEYLSNLLGFFDRGDLDAALRHAIPLSNKEGGTPQLPLSVPKARTELALSFGGTTSAPSLGLGPDLFGELRRRYRAAFEKLERQGRIEEAAFVLAELLDAPEEAVAFLERHRRLEQAAALAEGRELAPGLVVRQWFLAGNRQRATRIAVARGAYADAITRLERSGQHEHARTLRLSWAERLAESGNYAEAVELSWSIEACRALAVHWLDLAIDRGGVAGARMLAKKVASGLPDAADAALRAHELLTADGSEGRSERYAFAEAFSKRSDASGAHVEPIGRATIRSLYGDVAHGNEQGIRNVTGALRKLAQDPGLSADLPRFDPPAAGDRQPFRHVLRHDDRGTSEVFDAALLPRGRSLVALGEAGVAILGRDGKRIAQLDQPAMSLVVSDHGDRALALAPRGEAHRIARIDVAGRRSEPWCEGELGGFARTFDGSTWIASTKPRSNGGSADLVLIDALDVGLSALHRVDGIGSIGGVISRSKSRCEVLTTVPRGPFAALSFELPSWTLRGRGELIEHGSNGQLWACSSTGVYAALVARAHDDLPLPPLVGHRIELLIRGECRASDPIVVGGDGESLRHVEVEGDWATAILGSESGLRVVVVSWRDRQVRGEIVLEGAGRASARLQGGFLVVCDTLGRMLAIDLANGDLTRNLRVT